MLAEFVRRGWLEEVAATAMLAWPHSGFGACVGPPIEDREGLLRVVRYSVRALVLTLPKRLRAYFVHERRRLGGLSRVAYRTLREYLRAALGERELAPGVIACVRTFGSLAHAHPHLHVLVTDGAHRGGRSRRIAASGALRGPRAGGRVAVGL